MAAATPGDPRLRPFRIAAWGVYLLVATAFSLAVTVSVVRSVITMTPAVPPTSTELLPVAACVEGARSLFDELDRHRQRLTQEDGGAVTADLRWVRFRLDWLTRMRGLEARCGVAERPELRELFRRLERVLDLYTIHTIQFSGAVGPAVDGFRRALEQAGLSGSGTPRSAPSAAPP